MSVSNLRLTYKVNGKSVTESFASPAAQRKAETEVATFRRFQQWSRSFVEVNEQICRTRPVEETLSPLKKTAEAIQREVAQEVGRIVQIVFADWHKTGTIDLEAVPEITDTDTTYYDRPMLKQPVWSIHIPIYYFLGGTAGAALTLGAAIQLVSPRGRHPLQRLSAICHWTGIIGSTAGAEFLIHDLGRPSRFLYMMRVFRPTSPMNMGVWILSGAAPTAIATGLRVNGHDRRGHRVSLGDIRRRAGRVYGGAGFELGHPHMAGSPPLGPGDVRCFERGCCRVSHRCHLAKRADPRGYPNIRNGR